MPSLTPSTITTPVIDTRNLLQVGIRRPIGAVVFVGTTIGYLLVYLWAIGEFRLHRWTAIDWMVVDEPGHRMFEAGPGTYAYEPIAIIEFGYGTFLFSPINTMLGMGIALLVGANMVLSYLAISNPKACGYRSGAGILAAFPALLVGSACCAPAILLVLGIMATGTILAILPWLLPIGIVGLLASLFYVAGTIQPASIA